MIETSIKKMALDRIERSQNEPDPLKPKVKKPLPNPQPKASKQEALMRFLCIKVELQVAKKNICLDNRPVRVTKNLYIGSIGAASHRDNL